SRFCAGAIRTKVCACCKRIRVIATFAGWCSNFRATRPKQPPCNSSYRPIENYFPGVAGLHQLEAFVEFRIGKAVGDDGRNIEPALDERRHLVPRLEHLAAVNSFDRQAVEDDEVPIDRRAPGH